MAVIGLAIMFGVHDPTLGALFSVVLVVTAPWAYLSIRNRRLEVNARGMYYVDWRGRSISVDWFDVRRVYSSVSVGESSDMGYVRIVTLKGTIDILGLSGWQEALRIVRRSIPGQIIESDL